MAYTAREIVDIISKVKNNQETIEFINDLYNNVNNRKFYFLRELDIIKEEIANVNNICSGCGFGEFIEEEYLDGEDVDGNRGKRLTSKICKNCGKEFND